MNLVLTRHHKKRLNIHNWQRNDLADYQMVLRPPSSNNSKVQPYYGTATFRSLNNLCVNNKLELTNHIVSKPQSLPNGMRRIVQKTAKGGPANLCQGWRSQPFVFCIIPCPQYPGEDSPNPSCDPSAWWQTLDALRFTFNPMNHVLRIEP
jgi:hypothetical protein